MVRKTKGYYSISAVAKMFSVHQQTIRMYEKEGFISPHRSSGNTRLFTAEDIERLDEIIHLTHKLGINLAGVEMILKLKRHIKKLQKEVNTLFRAAQRELEHEAEISKKHIEASAQRLTQFKASAQPYNIPALPALENQTHVKRQRKKKS